MLLAAVLVALVGTSPCHRTATSQQAAPGATTSRPSASIGTGSAGIPYVGTGPAAEIIRGGYVAPPSGGTGDVTVAFGITYVGTGPAARPSALRLLPPPAGEPRQHPVRRHRSGAEIIRGGYVAPPSGGTGDVTVAFGITYVGTGPAAARPSALRSTRAGDNTIPISAPSSGATVK